MAMNDAGMTADGGMALAMTGEACMAGADCASGNCLTEASTGWTEGYCTSGCTSNADCNAGEHCGFRDAVTLVGFCVDTCGDSSECREPEYSCYDADGDAMGRTECAPIASGSTDVGGACTAISDCQGGEAGTCVGEIDGFRDGYCTAACASNDDCPGGSHCGAQGTDGIGFCLANCTSGSCRTDGYACYDFDGDTVDECAPAGTGSGAIGDVCGQVADCDGGADAVCLAPADDWFDGYCATLGCTAGSCPMGSHCSPFDTVSACLQDCTPGSCRTPGYACYDINNDGTPECAPSGTGSASVGEACEALADCSGGTRAVCVREADGFFEGYCTLSSCTVGGTGDESCPTGSHCAVADGETEGFCVDDCANSGDCRSEGYACYAAFGEDTMRECAPAATGSSPVGSACLNRWDCGGGQFGFCALDEDFLGGYCVIDCSGDTSRCPSGSACVATGDTTSTCLDECTGPADCRTPFYECAPTTPSNTCVPATP
jgi:hypothetical protein